MKTMVMILSLLGIVGLQGCMKVGRLEYGKVHAQFEASTIAERGKPFLDTKVTVRGTVTEHILNESTGKLTMVLDDEVHCVWYGSKRTKEDILLTIETYQIGKVVYLDGFLLACVPGNVVLDPVHGRDQATPFHPLEATANEAEPSHALEHSDAGA